MGTRGAFGVVIGEVEKIGYNQFDSYPDGKGVENLRWLRSVVDEGKLDENRRLAIDCRLVDEDGRVKPTPEDIERLAPHTNLSVSEQSTDDWYCLTRDTHGSIEKQLACGYIYDSHEFPVDSLFCEWAYIVDLDSGTFEIYEGFQKTLPTSGRWSGRPTESEDKERYKHHLVHAKKQGRDPWDDEVSEYKAVERIATYTLDALPTDEEFLNFFALHRARQTLAMIDEHPSDAVDVVERIKNDGLADEGKPGADEWAEIAEEIRLKLGPVPFLGQT